MGIRTKRFNFFLSRRRLALLTALVALPAQALVNVQNSPAGNPLLLRKNHFDAIEAINPRLPSLNSPGNSKTSYLDVIRAVEAAPDVVVFPIWVAGPVVASETRRLLTKVAQSTITGTISIIYPDIGEPYRSVFTQIINGIEETSKGRVNNYPVGPNVNIGELNNSLRQQNTRVVIALGRQGMKVASSLDSNIGVVVGGVLSSQGNEAHNAQVNSLSPDPALLFSRLKGMTPKVKRIYTVYDPRQNAWMITLAKEAARMQGLELIAREALDLRSAMIAYQEILTSADSTQDALWLPQDSTTVEDGSVLPLVLQESWTRNLAVFSSSFGHVKRGVLFSLYPNNVELGRHLANSALGFLASGANEKSGIQPLREVLMAINLRTAKHLDIHSSRQQGFAMSFPEK